MNFAKRQITDDDICMLQTSPRASLFAACYYEANGLLLPLYSQTYQKCLASGLILTLMRQQYVFSSQVVAARHAHTRPFLCPMAANFASQ
jgi:hypothetical protein